MDELQVAALLRANGCVYAEEEALLLLASASSHHALAQLLERRLAGEPIEVIVGWAEFCGHHIQVDPGVFVPRARTGVLVDEGSGLVEAGSAVVDLCCGTGAVGVALKALVPGIELYASDIDRAAVNCARGNLEPLDAQVFEGDLLDALPDSLRGKVDLLVVNAPYVPTEAISLMPPEAREHEPRAALDGGDDGVSYHRRIAADAADWLAPGGHLLIETSERQAPLTENAFRAGGLTAQTVVAREVDGTAVVGRVRGA